MGKLDAIAGDDNSLQIMDPLSLVTNLSARSVSSLANKSTTRATKVSSMVVKYNRQSKTGNLGD